MRFWLTIFGCIFLPVSVLAQDRFITRRDAFLLIWESINRPAYETSFASFEDMPDGDRGSVEITWAKRRGILDDIDKFYPDDPLKMEDALIWLYRSRNIEELPDMRRMDLWKMMAAYPLIDPGSDLSTILDQAELARLIRLLDNILAHEVHGVSFYADDFHGVGTAFGDTFDMHAITAAHRSFPQDTIVKVTNVENKKSVLVRINDRGPYVDGRDMDLSLAAFEKIAHRGDGVIRAVFERLGHKDLVEKCQGKNRVYQKRIVGDIRFHRGIPHTFTTGEQLVLQSSRWFVVRGISFPDGVFIRMQDFVGPKEKFRFTPALDGDYILHIGTKSGRMREMRMRATSCGMLAVFDE